MPPARGEGAIHAIQDAVKLAKLLSTTDKTDFASFKTALNEWQQEVVAKGYESILAGRRILAGAKAAAAAAGASRGSPPGGGPPGGAGGPPGGFKPHAPKCWGHTTSMIDEVKPLGITIAE